MKRVDHIAGQTYHGRHGKVTNSFTYSVDYLLLDPEISRGPRLFSRNRANLTSLHDSDHGGPKGQGRGVAWVREVLDEHGLDQAQGQILLLAQPRLLGHVFNPVSFWLCRDGDGGLRAVIAEVSNTFGDRHSYLCHHRDQRPIAPEDTLEARKIFHVSPFQPVRGAYRFNFKVTDAEVSVRIEFGHGEERLLATLAGPRQVLSNRIILNSALRRPFGARRVLGLIHWQAFILWWKGAPWHVRPEPPREEITR